MPKGSYILRPSSVHRISYNKVLLPLLTLVSRTLYEDTRLPPGPRGKPIVGNAGDMPTHHEWETYAQWAKKYGLVPVSRSIIHWLF
jgi:hypothetical protein